MIKNKIGLSQIAVKLLREALQFLKPGKNRQVWLVGGTIRDFVTGNNDVTDIDLSVSFDPVEISQDYAFRSGNGFVVLDDERKVVRLVKNINGKHYTIDIAHFRAENIDADLCERDFTINAMAAKVELPVENELEIYDPLNGLRALEDKLIVPCSEHLFIEDPLRIMRAIRFSARFNSKLSDNLKKLIIRDRSLLGNVSGERIRDELFKILATPKSSAWINEMSELGLFKIFLPELESAKSVEQNEWHHLDVFAHTILTLEKLEHLIENISDKGNYSRILKLLSEQISGERTYLQILKFGALLHDIGKPACKREDSANGKIMFHGHEMEGSSLCKDICERLRLSSIELSTLQKMVKNHMRPGVMLQQGINNRRMFRFFSETGRDGILISLLSLADRFSALGNTTESELVDFKKGIFDIIDEFYKQMKKPKQAPLITGNDIIKHLNIKPGPMFKQILDAVKEAQFLGEISTPEEAIELAKTIIDSN